MGSSILSEVDDTSILRMGLSTRYRSPLGWLPASRLLPPRSGLERSDFVPWHIATCCTAVADDLLPGDSGHWAEMAKIASVVNDPFWTFPRLTGCWPSCRETLPSCLLRGLW